MSGNNDRPMDGDGAADEVAGSGSRASDAVGDEWTELGGDAGVAAQSGPAESSPAESGTQEFGPEEFGTDELQAVEYGDDEYSDDEYSDDEYSDDDYSDGEYSDDDYSDGEYGDGDQDGDDQDDGDQDGDQDGDAPAQRPRRARAWPIRAALGAVLIGALVAGGVIFVRGGFTDLGDVGASVIGESSGQDNDFTRSEVGDCLTWDTPGEPSEVACAEPHRFEVAGVLDTADYPTSEFSSTAAWPGPERFAAIRDENCEVMVRRYLGGGLDPQGRFAPGLMFPSKVEWERGVRSLRCGIEQPGTNGAKDLFSGRVATIDQSFTWPDGTCIGIDRETRQPSKNVVDCSESHAFQVTGSVDLSQRFGDRNSGKPWPSTEDQNDYLVKICPTQTDKFFGGAEAFRKTTLNVQPSKISEVSWLTGSRRAFCYVALPDRGGFATLVGDAREELLINGKIPVPRKQGPPGRSVGTPVPLPPGYTPDDAELPAPSGG
ncbi:septum formation family protein [Gordonia shandongensis]|uniref:septum formation family protein n=1 Tax=Gordonia shandongensis TaxID=376351 RepID=UPI00047D93A6|nr:septum formation family protein [Gordonia shandongensis]